MDGYLPRPGLCNIFQMVYDAKMSAIYQSAITIYVLLLTARNSASNQGELLDYCDDDVFEAQCSSGMVVLVEEARYGRMGLGTCLKRDFGFIDCYSDVLHAMDKWCSGKYSCRVNVPDFIMDRTENPCPFELRSYLQARYTCLPVINPGEHCCQFGEDHIRIGASEGVIASSVSKRTRCGGSTCPWLIHAPKGQQLNVSLYDLTRTAQDSSCTLYATIKDGHKGATVSLCAGKERKKHVYTSESDNLEIRIVTSDRNKDTVPNFLIQYEVIGCPDIDPPSDGFVDREGDVAVISCKEPDTSSWEITCEDGDWSGYYGNCSVAIPIAAEIGELQTIPSFSVFEHFGPVLVIISIIGIGILISLAIVAIAVAYLKRNRNNQNTIPVGYHGHTFDKYSQRGHFIAHKNIGPPIVDSGRKGYYRTTERPWQSTRPLPEPEARRHTRRFSGLSYNPHVRESVTNIDPEVKYDVLDAEMVLLPPEATDSAIMHDYQNTTLHKGSVAI